MTSDLFTHFAQNYVIISPLLIKLFLEVVNIKTWCFQMTNAPSHRCRLAQQFLQANTSDFIHSDAWPPNSPDLNPLDYYVWNALKELVYAGRRKPCLNTDELKQVIEEKWSLLNDRHIQKSIGQWKQRLKVVTREGGAPIKHLFA